MTRRYDPAMRARLVAAALAGVLAVAGCGDDEGTDASDATSTTAVAEDRTSTTAEGGGESSDDQRLADAAVLVLSDLPPGFTETPKEDEGGAGEGEEDDPFEQCVGEEAGEIDAGTTAEAESSDFEKGDELLAGSIAFVLESEELAQDMMELFASDQLKECFNQAFAEGVREGAAEEGGELPEFTTKVQNRSFAKIGDETAGYRATLSFAVQGQELSFPVDFVFARKGRTVGMYFFGAIGGQFSVEQQAAIIGKALARVG